MLSRLSLRTLRTPFITSFAAPFSSSSADAVDVPEGQMLFNFSLPHSSIYHNTPVFRVSVPGLEGEFAVNAGHSAIVSELRAGVVKVMKDENDKEPDQWFISGGFSFTHEPNSTFITAVEACPLSELDEAEVKKGFAESQSKVGGLTEGSVEHAEAVIERETYRQMALALGVA